MRTLVSIFNSGFDFNVRSRQGSLAFLVILCFSETYEYYNGFSNYIIT